MKHRIAWIVLITLVTSLCLPMAAFAQAAGAQTVREIAIRGADHLPPADVQALQVKLKSPVGQPLDAATGKTDQETLMESGWFLQVTSRTEPVEGGVRLVFVVTENPVITKIAFSGNEVLTEARLQAVVKSQVNTVLNRAQVTEDALAIRRLYAGEGYIFADVVDLDIDPRTGVLTFVIFEPKISEIRIEGNKKTKDYVIRRELLFKPGDPYNEKDVHESLRALDQLGIFQEVSRIPEPGDQPGTIIATIRVVERRTGLASIGLGTSNTQGLIGFVDVADQNVAGTAQRVSARVQFGQDSSYSLSYTNPFIDTKRTSVTVNLYDRTVLRQAVQVNQTYLYNDKRSGADVTLGRPIARNTRAYVTLRSNRVRANPEDNNPVPPALLTGADVRSIGLSAIRDTRDSFFNPTRNSYLAAGVEFAGFGGANFTKFTTEGRKYWPVYTRKPTEAERRANKPPTPWVLASRVSLGTISGAPPFLDQFLAGGADTLRGFPEDRFPGENQLLFNNELRVPVTDALQIVGFVDTGTAWRGAFAQQFGNENMKLHTSYGLGIRIQTPIGPIRVDYGINTEGGNEIHFGVGPTF